MAKWWKEGVVYQIYPRSFQDSDGDGIGDIPGMISRLDYLKKLGADILWLSPVYASPDADNGYDISDYCAVHPQYGRMEDMERLLAEAKRREMKIVMDLVINHTSDEHEWFQKSRDKDSEYRDYYIWRPAKPDGSPPNNWRGFFMEDVWEFDPRSKEYYLHLFHKKQPDLNYKNPKVIEEIKGILRFWLDKGVAGFRCDVINILYKTSLEDGKKTVAVQGLEHYKSQEGNHDVLRELRRDVFSRYDCFTVGETVMVDLDEAKDLSDASRGELDMLFYFEHLEIDRRIAKYIGKKFKAEALMNVLAKWQRGLDWNAVYLENHDQPRIVSHYGDDRRYRVRSAKMLGTLEFTLGGTPFLFEGQELAMTNFDYRSLASLNDVESKNIDRMMRRLHIPKFLRWRWIKQASRDNARTPMQWSGEQNAGFSDGVPWLSVNQNYHYINAECAQRDPDSVFCYYQKLIRFRKSSDTVKYGDFVPLHANDKYMVYRREQGGEQLTVLLNFSGNFIKTERFTGEIQLSNVGRTRFSGELMPYEALVLKSGAGE